MAISYADFLKLIAAIPDEPNETMGCPATQTLNTIQGKWKKHILFFLCKKGSCRFGQIHKAHPQVSKTMLSSTLKQLETDGLVIRQQFNEIPPHTEYSLTEEGKDLMPIFFEMFKWGEKHLKNMP